MKHIPALALLLFGLAPALEVPADEPAPPADLARPKEGDRDRLKTLRDLRSLLQRRKENLEARRKTRHNVVKERLQEAERTLAQVRQDRIRAEVELNALEAEVKAVAGRPDLSSKELAQLVNNDPVVQGYNDQIRRLVDSESSPFRQLPDGVGGDRRLRRVHDQRMQARRAMEQRRGLVRQEIRRAQAAPMENPRQVERGAAAHSLAVLRGFEQELRSEVERLKKGMTDQDELKGGDQELKTLGHAIEQIEAEIQRSDRGLAEHESRDRSVEARLDAIDRKLDRLIEAVEGRRP